MADTNNDKAPDVSPGTLPSNAGKEYGQSGTLIFSGIITQEEYNRKLLGRDGIRIYEEMRRSDTDCQELLKACKLPIRSVTWRVEPASDDPIDVEAAALCERELFERNLNFSNTLGDILTMYDFGFSVFEKVYELTEFEGKTRIGIKKIASRKQYSILKWQTQQGQPGVTQQVAGALLDIPQGKILVFTHDKEGENYAGVSLLRYCYRDWYAKKILLNIQLVGLERLANGIPVLMPPEQPDAKDVEAARSALRKMRANQEAYMELPQGWSIEMLDMKSHTTKDILPTLEYLSGNIKKSGLAGFLDLGARNNGGSHAVGQDQSQIFEKSLEATANNIAATFNEHLIQELCDFNYSSLPNGYPQLKFDNIGDELLESMGQYLNQIASTDLLTPDPDLEDHLREIARLPKLPDDIRDNYQDRQLNQRDIKRIALSSEQAELMKLQPGADNGTLPTDPASKKAQDNLPADGKTKIKADVLADAKKVQRKLLDVILG